MYAILSNMKFIYGSNANIIRAICRKRYPNERILCIKRLVNF